MLVAFAFVMLVGALFAWTWIPEVQYSRRPTAVLEDEAEPERIASQDEELKQRERCKGYKIPSKTLETLGKGRLGEDPEKRIGFRTNLGKAWDLVFGS